MSAQLAMLLVWLTSIDDIIRNSLGLVLRYVRS